MAKKRAEKKASANRISKTTIILYAVIIIISIVVLSVMSASQQSSGGGGGCCDCSECKCICCCGSCTDCEKACGCTSAKMKGDVINPYTQKPMSASDYYCMYGTMPPAPPEAECDCNEQRDCPLQKGVCEGAKEPCVYGTAGFAYTCHWKGCDATTYRNRAENMGAKYQADEDLCDGFDNDCDGEKDEGCDEDKDNYCNSDMGCTGSKYNCKGGECMDCDDSNPAKNPGAEEICDGIDNNCDSMVDKGCECSPIGAEQACEQQKGVCAGTKRVCKKCPDAGDACATGQKSAWAGCNTGKIEGYKSPETGSWYCADGLDNDCDGKTDCEDSGCKSFCPTTAP